MAHTRAVEFASKGVTVRGDLVLPSGQGPFPLLVYASAAGTLRQAVVAALQTEQEG